MDLIGGIQICVFTRIVQSVQPLASKLIFQMILHNLIQLQPAET